MLSFRKYVNRVAHCQSCRQKNNKHRCILERDGNALNSPSWNPGFERSQMRCSPRVVLAALPLFQGLRKLGGPSVLTASFIGFSVLKPYWPLLLRAPILPGPDPCWAAGAEEDGDAVSCQPCWLVVWCLFFISYWHVSLNLSKKYWIQI